MVERNDVPVSWEQIKKDIQSMNCNVKKAAHKHNSYIFKNIAIGIGEQITTGSAITQFEMCIEDYVKAANQDYALHTGKELNRIANEAKRSLTFIVDGYYDDYLKGL